MTQAKTCLRCGEIVSPDMKYRCPEGEACPVFGAGEKFEQEIKDIVLKQADRLFGRAVPPPKEPAAQAFLREIVKRDAVLSAQIGALTRLIALNRDFASAMSRAYDRDAMHACEAAADSYELFIHKLEDNHRADCNAMRRVWDVDTLQVVPLSERQIARLWRSTRSAP